jgi:hypothetical protein
MAGHYLNFRQSRHVIDTGRRISPPGGLIALAAGIQAAPSRPALARVD